MVAYNFKPQFAPLIIGGEKQQTIRPVGKRRHARIGENVQLYTGLRTSECVLLGVAPCIQVCEVRLDMGRGKVTTSEALGFPGLPGESVFVGDGLDLFARMDGFGSWAQLEEWWGHTHGAKTVYAMLLIRWGKLI